MKTWKNALFQPSKIRVVIFLLSLALVIVSYLVTQAVEMKIELNNFTESIGKDTRENLISARNLLDQMVTELDKTSTQITKHDDLFSSEVESILKFSHELSSFDTMFVADVTGSAYNDAGYFFNVADQVYFQKVMQENDVVFSDILPSQRFGAIQIISVPLFSSEQERIGALFGLFSVDTFSHLINTVVDDGKNIYIVDSNGTYINCFDETHTSSDHGNFWDKFNTHYLLDMTESELQEDFYLGREGAFSFSDNTLQTRHYGYHMPLGIQDWQIVLTVEESMVNSHIHTLQLVDCVELVINAICCITMLVCVYSYFKRANSEVISINQEITKNNEMLQMAVKHTNQIIFEYHLQRHQIELKTAIPDFLPKGSVLSQVPDYFFESNFIAEGSISALKLLFETIQTKETSQADIQIINKKQEKIWYRVRMYNLYDEQGDLVGTIGNAENINMLKKGEAAIKRRDEMYQSFLANALLYARMNLTTAIVTEVNGKETQLFYQDYLNKLVTERVTPEYQSYAIQMLSLDTLWKEYQQGKEFIDVHLLMKHDPEPKWISCLVYRVHASDNAKVMFLIRDIDAKKRQEIILQEQAERDGLTGLYNASTTRAKINGLLQEKQALPGTHIFILLDLDNFKQINDTFGHATGDQVLMEVADHLTERFRSSDVLGRLGGDEFVVMLFDVRSDTYVDVLMNGLIESITKNYTHGNHTVRLSASIGVALAPGDGITFEELYKKADKSLYQVKKDGKNGYKRYEQSAHC